MEVTEWDSPAHSAVKKGSREEATALGGGGGEGGHRQSIQHLSAPPGDGDLFLIPGKGDIRSRRRLGGGGQELVPGKGGVEEDDNNTQQGGGEVADILILL